MRQTRFARLRARVSKRPLKPFGDQRLWDQIGFDGSSGPEPEDLGPNVRFMNERLSYLANLLAAVPSAHNSYPIVADVGKNSGLYISHVESYSVDVSTLAGHDSVRVSISERAHHARARSDFAHGIRRERNRAPATGPDLESPQSSYLVSARVGGDRI